ncbi:rho guanine nucleotide exchange factor 17-like isoform X2 [Artemia franciscana]|uniref:rho guanine nucleotide exchange factor 17-like isoform X2 n=1 Tax=Artemia franciscana TaxID=6661 RepID=UPI0032DAF79C
MRSSGMFVDLRRRCSLRKGKSSGNKDVNNQIETDLASSPSDGLETPSISLDFDRISSSSSLERESPVSWGSFGVSPPCQNIEAWKRFQEERQNKDTRTHVVGELYDTERSYIESLNILVTKYINYLKNSEGCYLIDSGTVDEIFYQIPAILSYHENFLCELRRRLETWDATTCVGDVITNCLTQPPVVATYIAFVSHWQVAKETVRMACQTKPAFGKFLMKMKSEHKGKLELDSLLIMPVQRIPRYELLIKLLLKHTAKEHPDHDHLVRAQREVHELAVKINCMEKDYMAIEQQQAMLRELETLVEGLEPGHLASPLRTLIRHDTVTIPSSTLGIRKERTLFLCSDLLVIASVKKKAVMKRSAGFLSATGSISGLLEANKLKLLMRVHLNDIRVKAREDSIRRSGFKEYESFEEDLATLSKIAELSSNLHVGHSALDDIIKDISANVSRHLLEKQASDSQLSILELTVHAQDSAELFQVAFSNPEHRATWEEAFHQTKANLAEIAGSRSQPDFITALPIRKTRPGLQLRCATPTFQSSNKEVWLCNSDSYVGQICLLSLDPEPNVASCQTVCNSKITSILSVPGAHLSLSKDSDESAESMRHTSSDIVESCLALDSDSSSDGEDGDESIDDESMTSSRRETNLTFSSTPPTGSQNLSQGDDCSGQSEAFLSGPTMWAGTEDGSIYIYCSTENIRNRRLKKKLELRFCVTDLLYGSDKVFASLANGDLVVFIRDSGGAWSLNEPKVYPIGTSCTPPARLALAGANIWVSVGSSIVILSGENIVMEDRIPLSGDGQRLVSTFSVSSAGVWVALNGPPVVRLFDSKTFSSLLEINITPVVNKILLGCDDIIRQHKSACLRITTMYSCKDILWIGTSAGVIINVQLGESNSNPQITGLMEGHTGHVRFLTAVEVPLDFRIARFRRHSTRECSSPSTPSGVRYLVVSGGDGFEDFSGSRTAEVTGKDDSTNHVLLWKV